MSLVRNRLLRDKSGLSFFMLLAVFAVFLFFLFFVVIKEPHADAIYDETFSSTQTVDFLSSNYVNHNLYLDVLVRNSLDSAPKDFFLEASVNTKLASKLVDEKSFKDCSYDGGLILYNEAYLDFQSNKSINESDLISCFPKFTTDFVTDFEVFVERDLGLNLESYFDEVDSLELNKIVVELEESNLVGLVSFTDGWNYINGEISADGKVNFNHFVGSFPDLISALGKVFPDLSEKIKSEISGCKSSDGIIGDKDLFCIGNIFTNAVYGVNPNILKKYSFNFSRVENSDVKEYYGISVDVFDKSMKNKLIFNFAFVLENNLPFGEVSYDLNSLEGIDNVINLKVYKPNLAENSLNGYVILYSYDDFLNPSSSGYDNLISILKAGTIPSGFEKVADMSGGEYRHSLKSSGIGDLSLFYYRVLDQESISEIINIHQIYDSVSDEFKLLESGKNVNFAVFAVDSKFNYFTDADLLKSVYKNHIPRKMVGPKPLTVSQIKSTGKIEGLDKSFEFGINGYDNPNVQYFELLIAKDRGTNPWVRNCEGVEYQCFSDNSIMVSGTEVKKYLVTSYGSTDYDEKYAKVISLPDIDLGTGAGFEFVLIPVDASGVGIYSTLTLSNSVKPTGSYYDFISSGGDSWSVIPNRITIVDKKAPDLSDIDINGLSINSVSGNLYFHWSLPTGSDVGLVEVVVNSYGVDRQSVGMDVLRMEKSSDVSEITYDNSIVSAEVSTISMTDTAGNSVIHSIPSGTYGWG